MVYEILLVFYDRENLEWPFLLVAQEWQKNWLMIWRAGLSWRMQDLTGKSWVLMSRRL